MTVQQTQEGNMIDPLDTGNLEALVAGRHGAPFDVLGPHRILLHNEPYWIVRAMMPGATAVSLLPSDDIRAAATRSDESETASALEDAALPMMMIHSAG